MLIPKIATHLLMLRRELIVIHLCTPVPSRIQPHWQWRVASTGRTIGAEPIRSLSRYADRDIDSNGIGPPPKDCKHVFGGKCDRLLWLSLSRLART
jgi:hypothetical protein